MSDLHSIKCNCFNCCIKRHNNNSSLRKYGVEEDDDNNNNNPSQHSCIFLASALALGCCSSLAGVGIASQHRIFAFGQLSLKNGNVKHSLSPTPSPFLTNASQQDFVLTKTSISQGAIQVRISGWYQIAFQVSGWWKPSSDCPSAKLVTLVTRNAVIPEYLARQEQEVISNNTNFSSCIQLFAFLSKDDFIQIFAATNHSSIHFCVTDFNISVLLTKAISC